VCQRGASDAARERRCVGVGATVEKYEQIVTEHWLPIMHHLNGEDVQGLPQV
jgi:hypothetical protein